MSGETWRERRTGTGHGIVVWFDADLAEGVGFSNAPGAPETIYGYLFSTGASAGEGTCIGFNWLAWS